MAKLIDGIDVHQDIMDRAYARWQPGGDLVDCDWEGFLRGLDALDRRAVILGKFSQQVCNGGLYQWHANEYGTPDGRREFADAARYVASAVASGLTVYVYDKIFLPANRILDDHEERQEESRNSWSWGHDEPEEDESWSDALDPLDDLFYDVDDAWCVQLEFYFRRASGHGISPALLDTYAPVLAATGPENTPWALPEPSADSTRAEVQVEAPEPATGPLRTPEQMRSDPQPPNYRIVEFLHWLDRVILPGTVSSEPCHEERLATFLTTSSYPTGLTLWEKEEDEVIAAINKVRGWRAQRPAPGQRGIVIYLEPTTVTEK